MPQAVETKRIQLSLRTAIALMFSAAVLLHGVMHDPHLIAGMIIVAGLTYAGFQACVSLNKFEPASHTAGFLYTLNIMLVFFLTCLFAILTIFFLCAIIGQIIYRT